ncbi:thioredoxin-like [Hetaerina americana]|uniref:thioredoxin-like n=1 Tax=Hetaerina americana TaxID=62018 RepID=UPI003A7F47AF
MTALIKEAENVVMEAARRDVGTEHGTPVERQKVGRVDQQRKQAFETCCWGLEEQDCDGQTVETCEKRVMNSDIPVLVNFHAEWCEPCQILTPLLRKLLATSTDVDLAVEDCPELVHTFEVKAVVAVTNGQVADKFVGLVDAATVEGLMNKLSVGNKKTTKGADTSHLENKHHSPQ